MLTDQEIRQLKDTIVKAYHPDKIILFGSYARGDCDENSDLDLLVLSDREGNLPRYKRGLRVRILLSDFPVKKDVLFYTHQEFTHWQDVENSFINQVLKEGKVIHG